MLMVVTGNIRGPWILEAALHHGPKRSICTFIQQYCLVFLPWFQGCLFFTKIDIITYLIFPANYILMISILGIHHFFNFMIKEALQVRTHCMTCQTIVCHSNHWVSQQIISTTLSCKQRRFFICFSSSHKSVIGSASIFYVTNKEYVLIL